MKHSAGGVRRSLLCALVFLLPLSVFSQDKEFFKAVIDTLCSPWYAGRGYVDNGAAKAASFLNREFTRFNLASPIDSLTRVSSNTHSKYSQEYFLCANTFPGRLEFVSGKKALRPGLDYMVDPSSPGTKKKSFNAILLDSFAYLDIVANNYPKLKKNTAVFIPENLVRLLQKQKKFDALFKIGPAAIIEIRKKLVWDVSCDLYPIPYLWIREGENTMVIPKKISLAIDQKMPLTHLGQNVIGYVKGTQYPDSFILITAHYDHLGKMGPVYFPGANDNASGTAMVVNLARWYSFYPTRYSVAFICFSGEEAGLVGSKYYTEYPAIPLKQTAFVINLDLMANGQDGMMVVNGKVFNQDFHRLNELNTIGNYLKEVKSRGKAANSDHYWFSEKGVKAFFFYLLGDYPHYHDIEDTPEKPTYAGYEGSFRLIRDFIDGYGK